MRWTLKLYNTLTRRVETFQPRNDKVTLYVCGITPYDTTHVGHAFTYASMDVLIRYLELRGQKVKYVQNITDVDDDILRRAKQDGQNWRELGNQWTAYYIQDMQDLNIRPPDHFPRASEVIDEIIASVMKLLEAGVAYESGGNVFYSIHAWPEFGKLSRFSYSQMLPIANERGNRPDDPNKRDPLDFVLWQAHVPGEPFWESPWGPGRPGWHIECSTMSTRFLGEVIDIHGGGEDLCFPHHECEIAQVEPITGKKPFVRFWMHTAMVGYKGEKMSKSLGNLVMIRDLWEKIRPDDVRLYLASHHYRTSWSFNEDDLKKAQKLANRIKEAVTVSGGDKISLRPDPAWASFTVDMDNDLDTPGALKVMDAFAGDILEAALARRDVKDAQAALRDFSSAFGLRLDHPDPEQRVKDGWSQYLQRFE